MQSPFSKRAFFIKKMFLVKKGLLFLIQSQVFISLCAVAFLFTGASLLAVPKPEIKDAALIFSATFLTYNLTAFLSGVTQLGSEGVRQRGSDGKKRSVLNFLLLLNLLLLFWSFPYHSLRQSLFLMHLGLISLLYNIPDRFAKTRFRSIRSVPLIKVFLIAYVWAAIGAWYPVLLSEPLKESFLLLFVLFFMFILAITLPFDIRDYHSDKRASLLTVPGVLGICFTKGLAIILGIGYGIGLEFFFGQTFLALVITVAIILLIVFSSEKRADWYYTGLIDSLIIVQFLLVYSFSDLLNL